MRTMPPLLAIAAHQTIHPSPWMVLPFLALLLCIALMPLFAPHFWEQHYAKVAIGLGLVTAGYYAFGLHAPESLHHAAQEYVSFMALIGSLFVISGGINFRVKGSATPMANVSYLALGAVLANIVGTTGASMLLIRPWIKMNKVRITGYHVVFFIFIVSNCGGALTPIGDPPLFLGFLRGVPFWWVLQHCWQPWLMCVSLLLAVFYGFDRINHRKAPAFVRDPSAAPEKWSLRGKRNLLLLAVVLGAVFIDQERKLSVLTLSATVMLVAALASYLITKREVHEANDFNFGPVQEVGFLFIGIFLTMLPALDLLQSGDILHLETPLQFYFASGSLSAFLDNAPTYLAFLAAEMGSYQLDIGNEEHVGQFVGLHAPHLIAVSLGAVFFGAGSYIGNGPNFMVKAIAEKAHVKTPSFLGYLFAYSLPILLPILVAVGWCMVRV
jgi:Na+/H+ antiporter NhaD/arsenite permease-like protein